MREELNEQSASFIESKKTKRRPRSKEFFYSESLDAYVAIQPLKADNRTVEAASELGIELNWNDEGRIINITYLEAKKLAEKLDAFMLSPSDYWKVYNEVLKKGDTEIIEQLSSNQSTEWLDVIFEKDEKGNVFMTEHPKIIETDKGIKYEGERKKITIPEGRPGWFNPQNNINFKTGLPIRVDLKREKGTFAWNSTNWKYWAVFKINEPVAAIRGYVTSSGAPSLDCDIPVGAKHPVLMLRESRKELLEPAITPELLETANKLVRKYLLTTVDKPAIQNPQEHESFYSERETFFNFLKDSGREFMDSKDKEAQKVKEKLIDILGIVRLMAKTKGDQMAIKKVDELTQKLFDFKKEKVGFSSFSSFILGNQKKLEEALTKKRRIIFVMGHKNPDTDTAVSCLAEAYRNSLLDKDVFYIPVIQGSRIPDEIKRLLGDEISNSILLTDNPNYNIALNSGQARWILVDQNTSEVQKFTVSIVDHHILSNKAEKQDAPKTWEMVGSTTCLIAQKFHGMGLEVDKGLARIFYGATLMDTENRSDKKMTYKDNLIMDDLKKISEIEDGKEFYQDLMSHLLNTDDAKLLFNRDYKEDWGFGFAVAKVKNVFGAKGEEFKKDLLRRLVNLAEKNNKDKNLPLTVVNVVDYLEDNETINRERIYLIFNQHALPGFKETMLEFITKIIQNEFRDKNVQIKQAENFVEFWKVGDQLSRKVTAPFLEPVVEAYNEYFYSPSTGLWVKREFLKIDEQIKKAAHELEIELYVDREGRINNITYNEAKQLLDRLGLEAMSLSEYWKILKEAEEIHDEQMLKHLRSADFVEFLDTIINEGYIIDHPKIKKTEDGYEYIGEKKKVAIPEGVPGLIYPEDIDLETGFPKAVQDPRQYGDKRLWRYWSPDTPLCVATRGHIFLLNQPSFDTKIHPDDALPHLGIRPCRRKIELPIVEIVESEKDVMAKITKRT